MFMQHFENVKCYKDANVIIIIINNNPSEKYNSKFYTLSLSFMSKGCLHI